MVATIPVYKYPLTKAAQEEDLVAVEEPLEIILIYNNEGNWVERPLIMTMRTPGNDLELTLGLLLAEGIIHHKKEVDRIWHCEQAEFPENTIKVRLTPGKELTKNTWDRAFVSHSGCGVCGKIGIQSLEKKIPYPLIIREKIISTSLIYSLNELLGGQQIAFRYTGGIHASALFSLAGELQLIREDIGRHNSMDKVIGAGMTTKELPFDQSLLFLSSRISYELVQKALMAGIPILAAVGAPSSLAISLAKETGLTLIGFVREGRFNVYSFPERLG